MKKNSDDSQVFCYLNYVGGGVAHAALPDGWVEETFPWGNFRDRPIM